MKKEDELIIRYLDQNLSEAEVKKLDQSLKENSDVRKRRRNWIWSPGFVQSKMDILKLA